MPRRFNDNWGGYPPPSRPIRTQGGIKLQANHQQNWWAKRWLAMLDQLGIGSRLARGRSYARNGQVMDLTILAGQVSALVQGSQLQPYRVTLVMQPLGDAEWERALVAIESRAAFIAQLLNGQMPQEIESAFAAADVDLFPTSMRAIKTSCSCPDMSNPCKHIAAVYYLIGQEFDRDPFLLFVLRGMDRAPLLARLAPVSVAAEAVPREPLPADPAAFWQGAPIGAMPLPATLAPPVAAPLLRQLGPFPLWRGATDPKQALEDPYRQAAARALALSLSWRGDAEGA